ncbi:uncharacterized protein SPAR_M03470 [Saccharomyces paradoxus]|uniref:Uncharacterized protein n=1 Tax=Saccharomyces paradoxus TaxID=27291 RepID=A0A8B8UXN7_SACPA|nr:uncharacterized protein SPAR_M03470 [Saccharomyces paradoxus]QHS75502.1 hypothetical protein SPAR_M03470 [Saccharomyces paradoxus]
MWFYASNKFSSFSFLSQCIIDLLGCRHICACCSTLLYTLDYYAFVSVCGVRIEYYYINCQRFHMLTKVLAKNTSYIKLTVRHSQNHTVSSIEHT